MLPHIGRQRHWPRAAPPHHWCHLWNPSAWFWFRLADRRNESCKKLKMLRFSCMPHTSMPSTCPCCLQCHPSRCLQFTPFRWAVPSGAPGLVDSVSEASSSSNSACVAAMLKTILARRASTRRLSVCSFGGCHTAVFQSCTCMWNPAKCALLLSNISRQSSQTSQTVLLTYVGASMHRSTARSKVSLPHISRHICAATRDLLQAAYVDVLARRRLLCFCTAEQTQGALQCPTSADACASTTCPMIFSSPSSGR